MKVLNIVLSVLILLLAIASAVFAFFLYEKREQMTNGWAMMARAINEVSGQLDKDSGTAVADNLTASDLAHQNYANLQQKLNQLTAQAKAYVDARNVLATSLIEAANAAGVNVSVTSTQLTDIGDAAAARDAQGALIGGIRAVKQRMDDAAGRAARIANKLGVSGADFNGAQAYAAAYEQMEKRADIFVKQVTDYREQIANIAKALNAPLSEAVSEGNYTKMLNDVLAASRKTTQELAAANKQINDPANGLLRQIANLNNDIDQRDQTIREKDTLIAQRDGEIRRLIAVIDPSNATKPDNIWADGAPEARKALQGRVLEVNDKYGIITVDLGKNTRVRQLVGQNRVEVDPQIPADITMAVIRDKGDDRQPEYVGRIKLVRVNDNFSIAESVKEEGGTDRKVRVGDIVIFTDTDLAQLPQS